jgi:hypothetical protein
MTNEPDRAAGLTTHPEFRVALQPSPRKVVPSSGPVTGTDSVAPSAARNTPPSALRRPHCAERVNCETTRCRPPECRRSRWCRWSRCLRQALSARAHPRSVDATRRRGPAAPDRAPPPPFAALPHRSAPLPRQDPLLVSRSLLRRAGRQGPRCHEPVGAIPAWK